jgi:transcriptional regulator with XRE-family HTH domain
MDRGEFATHIGVHRDSVARYEADRAFPRKPVLSAWALATGVRVEWLERGTASEGRPGPDGGGANTETSDYKGEVYYLADHSSRQSGAAQHRTGGAAA